MTSDGARTAFATGTQPAQLHRTPAMIEVARAGSELQTDHGLLASAEALAFDTGIAQRAASSFPDPLAPGSVTDVATEVGPLYVHARDRVITRHLRDTGSWEAAETSFLRGVLQAGHTFIDVGANVGYFSVLGSSLVGPNGRVVAVEPEQRNLSLLKANLWRNRCANAVVLPIAAGRETGFLPLRLDEKNRGNHQVGRSGRAKALVPCARLDDLLASLRIDVVKVDTQGSDHDVIAGLSEHFLAGTRPTILCEFAIEEMQQRDVDPLRVAKQYEELGFMLALLSDQGAPHSVSPAEVVSAARGTPIQYVNLVLGPRY